MDGRSPIVSYHKFGGVKFTINYLPKGACRVPQGNEGILCLLPIWQQSVCSQKSIFLEKDLVSKRNIGSKVDLEGVQDPQGTIEAQTETREEPQGVVEAPLITQGQRSSDRTRFQSQRCGSLVTENRDVLLMERGEPTTYQEVIVDPNSKNGLKPWRQRCNPCTTIRYGP